MKAKRLIAMLLTIVTLCGVVPYVETEVEAATFVRNPSEAKGSDYTLSSKLAKKLDEIFAGDIDIYYDSNRTNEVYFPLGSRMDNGHVYTIRSTVYMDGDKDNNKNTSGQQCWIYANAVYNKLFGEWIGQGNGIWYGSNVITPGSAQITYEMFRDADIKTGAYVRTTAKSNGQYDGNSGHSFIILSYNSTGLTYIEGNGDGNGIVQLVSRTWDEYNSSQLKGMSRYICHVFQPYDQYYDDWYPVDEPSDDTTDEPSVRSFSDKGYVWPITGKTYSRGVEPAYNHYALDISAESGTTVVSTAAGTVTCASTESADASHKCTVCGFTGAGYHVMVRHDDGVQAMYAHLSKVSVTKGSSVSIGEKLGAVGSTGNSTGAHLHFALFEGGITNDHALDPLEYVSPFGNVYAADITETGAVLYGDYANFGIPASAAGVYIGTNKNADTKIQESFDPNADYWRIYYGTEKWYQVLQPGTTYYYRMWISYNGKEYVSTLESFTTAGPPAQETPQVNLALGADYETSLLYRSGEDFQWDENASITYPDEKRSSLTDGFYAPKKTEYIYTDMVWSGFNAKSPDYQKDGYSWITVDLGDEYDLNRYTLWVAPEGADDRAGIHAPNEVEFLASDDGVHFTSIGVVRPVDTYEWPYMPITLEKDVTARYIKARIRATTNWMLVSEIEVWSTECPHKTCETLYVRGENNVVCREIEVCIDCGAYVSDWCAHEMTENIVLNSTCVEKGCDMEVCVDCGERLAVNVFASYGEHYNEITDAVWGGLSCWTETVGYYCRICKEYYEVIYDLPAHALDANYELVDFKAPTCMEEGYEYYECSLCHTSYVEYLPATGHTVVVSERVPTCADYGYYKEYCYDCGEEFVYEEYEPTGHEYQLATIVLPSCTKDGYNWYCCSKCEAEYEEPIPATGHNYQNNVCTNCGDMLVVEYGVELHVTDVKASAGDTVTMDIVLDKNVGFTFLNLWITYDTDALELISVENGSIVESMTQGRSLIWACADNATGEGVLATLTFAVKEGVEAGEYSVAVTPIECCDEKEIDVAVAARGGTVTVTDYIYGDCNGDNVISGKDVTRLLRYLANYNPLTGECDVEISRGGDATGDGKIDGKDATRLIRYLANYNPITGESTVPLGPAN